MAVEPRNQYVEIAVNTILSELDSLIAGAPIPCVVPPAIAKVFDSVMAPAGGSARLAMVFFIAYSLTDGQWNYRDVPVGIRGQYGDKKLAAALTTRHVTFHNAVTAFGENLGWKGNVRAVDLANDRKFSGFLAALAALSAQERRYLLHHAIWRLFESRVIPRAMPPLPPRYLTYARALSLCEDLLALRTEGHVQQFLVAAFLSIHRARVGHTVMTHHPHAADTFDGTCGDIEEFRESTLVAAYEVTVRDDWKNRLPDFHHKMVQGNLSKYVIIASNVHFDLQLASASQLLRFTENLTYDLAIVDIRDFFCVFCAELSTVEIAQAIDRAYQFLLRPNLCGRADFQAQYLEVVNRWLGAAPSVSTVYGSVG